MGVVAEELEAAAAAEEGVGDSAGRTSLEASSIDWATLGRLALAQAGADEGALTPLEVKGEEEAVDEGADSEEIVVGRVSIDGST